MREFTSARSATFFTVTSKGSLLIKKSHTFYFLKNAPSGRNQYFNRGVESFFLEKGSHSGEHYYLHPFDKATSRCDQATDHQSIFFEFCLKSPRNESRSPWILVTLPLYQTIPSLLFLLVFSIIDGYFIPPVSGQ